jgi:hypothetical protein
MSALYKRGSADDPRYQKVRAERERQSARQIARLMTMGFVRIPAYSTYLISNEGVIYSTHDRRVLRIKPGVKPGGYRFVGLTNEGRATKYEMVHRLVANTFIANPENLPEVNHKDGNKRNNRDTNLEWCTRQQNAVHGFATGLLHRGLKHPGAKLNADQVRAIRHAEGKYRDIGRQHNVCAQTVCKIKAGRAYRDVA